MFSGLVQQFGSYVAGDVLEFREPDGSVTVLRCGVRDPSRSNTPFGRSVREDPTLITPRVLVIPAGQSLPSVGATAEWQERTLVIAYYSDEAWTNGLRLAAARCEG